MAKIEDNDLRFFRSTANELNNLLTELSGYMEVMDNILRKSGGDQRLIPMMNDTLARATKLTLGIQRHVYLKEGHDVAAEVAGNTSQWASNPSSPDGSGSTPPRHDSAAADSQQGDGGTRQILGLDVPIRAEKNSGDNMIDRDSLKYETTSQEEQTQQPSSTGGLEESQAAGKDVDEKEDLHEAAGKDTFSVHPKTRQQERIEGSSDKSPSHLGKPEQPHGKSMTSSRNIDSALMGKQEQILVVDDEKNILLLVEMMLRSANYRMLKAVDGEEALAIFADQADQIDLVILDFTMQGMDGQELFERMIELKPDARILISSGYAEAGALKEMMAQGLRGYIPKPYSRDRLLFQIKSVLEG